MVFSDSHARMLKHIHYTHVENDLLVLRTMLFGSATTVEDERNKNRSKEIMITLMDALISILALRDASYFRPCLALCLYILSIRRTRALLSMIIQNNFVEVNTRFSAKTFPQICFKRFSSTSHLTRTRGWKNNILMTGKT